LWLLMLMLVLLLLLRWQGWTRPIRLRAECPATTSCGERRSATEAVGPRADDFGRGGAKNAQSEASNSTIALSNHA
jgi:hypothetical protein